MGPCRQARDPAVLELRATALNVRAREALTRSLPQQSKMRGTLSGPLRTLSITSEAIGAWTTR